MWPLFAHVALTLLPQAQVAPQAAPEWGPWYVAGPFDHPGGAGNIARAHPPEQLRDLRAGGPGPDLDKTYRGKGARIGWRLVESEGDRFDLTKVVAATPDPLWSEYAAAYLYRKVTVAEDVALPFYMGSDDGLRFWLNGELVVDANAARGLSMRSHRVTLRLRAGVNHILAKVSQGGGAWGFGMEAYRPVQIDRARTRGQVSRAIQRGVRFLLENQHLDGSWGYKAHEFRSGHTALVTYSLLRCGVPRDHYAIRMALENLRANPPHQTYPVSCLLLALGATGDSAHQEWIRDLAAELISWQAGDGLFSYPDARPVDLSNALFAVMGLRAASKNGVKIPDSVWVDFLDGTLGVRERVHEVLALDGSPRAIAGFTYRPGWEATGSMTTAGISLLAASRERLGGRLPRKLHGEVAEAEEQALAWLDHHFTVVTNPGHSQGQWHYYYLYGIERSAGLLGLEYLGEHDWYWEGASYLVAHQQETGAWRTSTSEAEDEVDTCFALLFLKRATAAALTGKGGSLLEDRYGEDDPAAALSLRASGDTPMTIWCSSFGEAARACEWEGEEGQGPRILAVEYRAVPRGLDAHVEPRLVGRVERAPGVPADKERFAVRHEFPSPGWWTLWAEAEVELPPSPGSPPSTAVLRSGALAVEVGRVLEPWRLAYAGDAERNLLARMRDRTVTASSRADGAHHERFAVDDLPGRGWAFAPADEAPWIRIELRRPVRADTILVTPLFNKRGDAGRRRVARVRVRLNRDGDTIDAETDPDPRRKTAIPFGKARTVQRLEVLVVHIDEGGGDRSPTGLAEIELQLQR